MTEPYTWHWKSAIRTSRSASFPCQCEMTEWKWTATNPRQWFLWRCTCAVCCWVCCVPGSGEVRLSVCGSQSHSGRHHHHPPSLAPGSDIDKRMEKTGVCLGAVAQWLSYWPPRPEKSLLTKVSLLCSLPQVTLVHMKVVHATTLGATTYKYHTRAHTTSHKLCNQNPEMVISLCHTFPYIGK